jgi:hypothetical protein
MSEARKNAGLPNDVWATVIRILGYDPRLSWYPEWTPLRSRGTEYLYHEDKR